jgi:hypothetical protein
MENTKAVHLVIMFGFNYPDGFIYKVWNGHIADHLQSKFNSLYRTYTARAVFQTFYTNLDAENQKQLVNWILENYKG